MYQNEAWLSIFTQEHCYLRYLKVLSMKYQVSLR